MTREEIIQKNHKMKMRFAGFSWVFLLGSFSGIFINQEIQKYWYISLMTYLFVIIMVELITAHKSLIRIVAILLSSGLYIFIGYMLYTLVWNPNWNAATDIFVLIYAMVYLGKWQSPFSGHNENNLNMKSSEDGL